MTQQTFTVDYGLTIVGGDTINSDTGNIAITSTGANTWTFDNTGVLTVPGNIVTNWVDIGNIGNIAVLSADALLQITTDASGSAPYWTFNTDGNLFVPGNINGKNTAPLVIDGAGYGNGYISLPYSTFGGEQIVIVNDFSLGNGIALITNGGSWHFDNTGNLTVPGNIVMPPSSTLTGTGASPAPSIDGFGTISSETVQTVSISVEGGRINGGFSTVVTDGINSIALGAGATMDVYGFPFSGAGVRGQLTITDVTTPSQANGNWYYQSVSDVAYQLYTNSTYSTLVDASGWSAYTGGGNVAITKQDPASNVVINSNGYFSTFDNTGTLNLPGDLDVDGNIIGNTAGYAIGYRDIPQVSFAGDTTIATTDAGKHYYSTESTDYTLTIANNASQGFQVGSAITVVNQGTGNITIAQGSGVTLYMAGNATSGNRSVATFGMATIMKVATNIWFVSGVGVA